MTTKIMRNIVEDAALILLFAKYLKQQMLPPLKPIRVVTNWQELFPGVVFVGLYVD